MVWGQIIGAAVSAYGAKRGRDQAKAAQRFAEERWKALQEFGGRVEDMMAQDRGIMMQQLAREQSLIDYDIQQNNYRNTLAAQNRQWDINFINQMLGIKSQEQMREILRQNNLDAIAAQDFSNQFEWFINNANLAETERNEARADLDRFNNLLARERAYEEGEYEYAKGQMEDERAFAIDELRNYQNILNQERQVEELQRLAIENRIDEFGDELYQLQRSWGEIPTPHTYTEQDIQRAADRRFANVEDAFNEETDRAMSQLSAASKSAGLDTLTASGISSGNVDANRARLIAQTAARKNALRNDSYDQAMREISNLQSIEDARYGRSLQQRDTQLDKLLKTYTPRIDYMLQLPKLSSAAFSKDIQSAAIQPQFRTSAASDSFLGLKSAIYDRPAPTQSALINNLNIPSRVFDSFQPGKGYASYTAPRNPNISGFDGSSQMSLLGDIYGDGASDASDNAAGAWRSYGQDRRDAYGAVIGAGQAVADRWLNRTPKFGDAHRTSGNSFSYGDRFAWPE